MLFRASTMSSTSGKKAGPGKFFRLLFVIIVLCFSSCGVPSSPLPENTGSQLTEASEESVSEILEEESAQLPDTFAEEAPVQESVPEETAGNEKVDFSPNTLPVLYLNIDESLGSIRAMHEDESHTTECHGTMDIVVPDGYAGGYGDSVQESRSGIVLDYIRGRGNSTWIGEKKPYKLRFTDKEDLFGMGANRHYVLLANSFDKSLVRNRFTFDLSEALGMQYAVQGVSVDLVMNQRYMGSYYLAEHIRIGSARVDIGSLTEEDDKAPALYGGYLLEMKPWEGVPDSRIVTRRNAEFASADPSFNPLEDDGYTSEAQRDYIRAYLQNVEDAIFSEDGKAPDGRHFSELLDLRSAADYWLIMQISQNQDAYETPSCYLYKKRFEEDGSEGRLYFGPVWDLDAAYGSEKSEIRGTEGFDQIHSLWTDKLLEKPVFQALLQERWKKTDRILTEALAPGGLFDRYEAELSASYNYDAALYPENIRGGIPESRPYNEVLGELRSWLQTRQRWINEHLPELID